MHKSITAFIIILLSSSVLNTLVAQNTKQSVFAEGNLFKLGISKTGLYKISYEDLKNNTPLSVDALNPQNISIYGNEGGLLPLDNNAKRADDLVENAIYIKGEQDGSFDPGDYILFYAEGADRVNVSDNTFIFEKNIYDTKNYFYIKLGASKGKRITTQDGTPPAPNYLSKTETLKRHEVDLENLLGRFGSTQGSGKQWYGETFTGEREQSFSNSFQFSNIIPTEEVELKMLFSARGDQNSSVRIDIDGNSYTGTMADVDLGEIEALYASTTTITEKLKINNSSPNVKVTFLPTLNGTEGWLDYIEIIAKERTVLTDSPLYLRCRSTAEQPRSGYSISTTATDTWVWNISDATTAQNISYNKTGNELSFSYETESVVKSFVSFDPTTINTRPEFLGQVNNQNLHAIERADMLIIYDSLFVEAAQKLANHRTQNDGLIIELVNIEQVYNEFAGGKADPVALRDMARMLHQRDPEFKYMLLMGDATYDYRGVYKNLENHNFVPTYQTDSSLNPIYAFPSDDFFGLLSDDEGADDMTGNIDIGIGRLPCSTIDHAIAMVNKIVSYDTNPNRFGDWRTKIGFAADDVDATWDTTHARDADAIARNTATLNPCLNQQKNYFDAYVQESTPGGSRYPDANKAIADNIFSGQLVFSYLGHGGPKGLSQERVIQISDVRNWRNMDKLPIFITATCSFTGFDEPNFVSAGEHLIRNPNGGAVALFTTVRSVFASGNKFLTQNIFDILFSRSNGLPIRLGEVLVIAQNKLAGNSNRPENTRKFLLMGDPSMRIALPDHKVMITEVNGEPITESSQDTIGALGKATLRGQIVGHESEALINGFNGQIGITIYDKASELKTLMNDGNGPALNFTVKNNILYKGSATITNGEFNISLILPKDINFNYGPGTVSLYATDDAMTDAIGCYDKLIIGGASSTQITDDEGPEIGVFMNDRAFVTGGRVNKEPILIVDLKDENGINLSSTSIGHDITATLEDQNGDKIVLNEFYTPTPDKIGQGTVTYQMPKLEPGPHKIYIKAWDILNNSTEQVTEFVVSDCGEGFIEQVYNYPNPFSTVTDFTFEHDLVNSNVNVTVSIFSLSGKLVKSISESRFSTGTRINDIRWNGTDDYGNKLAKGIYLYKINLYSPELDVRRESDFRKLAIIH